MATPNKEKPNEEEERKRSIRVFSLRAGSVRRSGFIARYVMEMAVIQAYAIKRKTECVF